MQASQIVLTIVCAILCVNRSQAQQTSADSLCYLADGGSSQTFIVNEASPVDFVIGNVQVSASVAQLGKFA